MHVSLECAGMECACLGCDVLSTLYVTCRAAELVSARNGPSLYSAASGRHASGVRKRLHTLKVPALMLKTHSTALRCMVLQVLTTKC